MGVPNGLVGWKIRKLSTEAYWYHIGEFLCCRCFLLVVPKSIPEEKQ